MEMNFQKERRTILICGAGIAGLASALFMSRAGFRVEIFEQAEKLDPIGSGLQLSPNAMHVLAELELEEQIKAVASAPSKIEIHNGLNGKKITQILLGDGIVDKYGQQYLVIHRADLQEILLGACLDEPDIQVRMGTAVQDAVSHANGITVIADGPNGTGNYRGIGLLAADGVNSIIRSECFHCTKSISTGTFALRALVKSQDMPTGLHLENILMWLAPNAHAVVYPVRNGTYHNIVLTVPDNFGEKSKEQIISGNKFTGANIAASLDKWDIGFTQLLDLNTRWTSWPLRGAPKLDKWSEGSIVLVGDAAHAMTPHAAQGAAMGLEDAAVLRWAISKRTSLPEAFRLYQSVRMPRAAAVSQLSGKNKKIYQLPQGLAIFRNMGMRYMGGEKIFNRQDWIYRWKPPIIEPN